MRQFDPSKVPDEWKPTDLTSTESICAFAKGEVDYTAEDLTPFDSNALLSTTKLWCDLTIHCIREGVDSVKTKSVLQRATTWFKLLSIYKKNNNTFNINALREMKRFNMDTKNCVLMLNRCIYGIRGSSGNNEAFETLEKNLEDITLKVRQYTVISDSLVLSCTSPYTIITCS